MAEQDHPHLGSKNPDKNILSVLVLESQRYIIFLAIKQNYIRITDFFHTSKSEVKNVMQNINRQFLGMFDAIPTVSQTEIHLSNYFNEMPSYCHSVALKQRLMVQFCISY